MNTLILQFIMSLSLFMQNPQVPLEMKVKVYNESLPVISKYMDEVKNEEVKVEETAVEETAESTETESAPVETENGIDMGNSTGVTSA